MRLLFRPREVAAWLLLASLWSDCLTSVLHAQEVAKEEAQLALGQCRLDAVRPGPLTLGRRFVGIDRECLLCHSSGNQGGYAGPLSLIEAKIWRESDPHSSAYAALLGEASQQMGRRLGNATAIHRDARCLACHSGFPLHNVKMEDGLVPESLVSDPRNLLAWGISCEACHGAAKGSDAVSQPLAGWLEAHRDPEWIKKFTAVEKQSQFGLYDVHSPLGRARLCVSCHVGDAAEGRVVTHEMYAAGHPPLPSFELATFAQQMPPHWKFKPADSELAGQEAQQVHLQTLRALGVGAAVTWAEQLRLTAELVNGEISSPAEKTRWPELAQFECFACHHELRKDSWRLERTLAVTPGRPLLRGAPSPIFHALLAATGGDSKQLAQHEQNVMAAITQRPFGAPAATLTPVLLAAADWADQEAVRLEGIKLTGSQLPLLMKLSEVAAADVYEYDTARQLSWAFQAAMNTVDSETLPAEIATEQKAIAEMFLSHLPSARTLPGIDSIANSNREVRLIDLAIVLPPIADYNAVEFRRRFALIHNLLQPAANDK